MNPNYEPLFHWVREREKIRIAKESGKPAPWTSDEILAGFRFCNVRREDDSVTRWIDANIRKRFANHPNLWLMLCIGRQINWPDTLAELIETGAWPDSDTFTADKLAAGLQTRADRGDKVWTGAYVISAGSVAGTPKSSHIALNVIGPLWRDRVRLEAQIREGNSLQKAHEVLSSHSGWGQFMAYQAIVDMRFTHILRNATDVKSWAAAGPGTLRGLNRVHGRGLNDRISQRQALDEILAIDAVVRPATGVEMDLSDVPNILCETDKYLRVANGEGRPRAKYDALKKAA